MTSSPRKKLKNDIIYSLLLAAGLFIILFYLNNPTAILENIDEFNSTTTTALGLVFTVLTIIYTFESNFEENEAVQILKERGKYQDVIEVFVLSVATIGLIWIFTFVLTVTDIHKPYGQQVRLAFAYLCITGLVLLIERLRRCFWIFVTLNRAMKSRE